MIIGSKHVFQLCLPALLTAVLFTSACENDIKKIHQLASSQANADVDTVHGVDVIYSDSAHVKFRVLSPLLLQHTGKNDEYNLMPTGVHITIFDRELGHMGTVTADTGIQRAAQNRIEFHKNVVARNDKGETFKSDELIWDENTKMMHSNKPVEITMSNGDIVHGIDFTSDQSLGHWKLGRMTGIFNVNEKDEQ